MSKYVCTICGYVYDEAVEGPFDDLPAEWVCPECGAPKALFEKQKDDKAADKPQQRAAVTAKVGKTADAFDFSAAEAAILCSNLAKGCEKQYLFKEQQAFLELKNYYEARAEKVDGDIVDLEKLMSDDITLLIAEADSAARNVGDRGALRTTTWSQKSTKIAKSVLDRFAKEGGDFILQSKVFVCEICGFIYVGDEVPDVCPVCKVPKSKIVEMRR